MEQQDISDEMISDYKLDNPVWYSLSEIHQHFAIEFPGMKFYHPDYCPFGGFLNIDNSPEWIHQYSQMTDNFYVVGQKPNIDNRVKLMKELVCNQMVLENAIEIEMKEQIVEIGSRHVEDLFRLVNYVQPGYFRTKTSELGSYYGIWKNNQLVAVAGERMKMNGYTEVSAVVTSPEHTHKGYAAQLISHTATRIFKQGRIPYLHVADTNIVAVKLYEKLGFTTRRKVSFWNVVKI